MDVSVSTENIYRRRDQLLSESPYRSYLYLWLIIGHIVNVRAMLKRSVLLLCIWLSLSLFQQAVAEVVIPPLPHGKFHVSNCTFKDHPSEATQCGLDWVNSSIKYWYCAHTGITWTGGPASWHGALTGSTRCAGGYTATLDYDCPSGYSLSNGVCIANGSVNTSKSSGRPKHCVGNPCDPATGNKFQMETDYDSLASSLKILRYYNSGLDEYGSFGAHWRSSFDRSIYLVSNANVSTAIVERADGKVLYFTLDNGVWQPDEDVSDRLVQTSDGWAYSSPDGVVENYDTSGRLLSETDSFGRHTAYTYDDGKLSKLTGPYGHELTFTYHANDYVKTITNASNETIGYVYSQDETISDTYGSYGRLFRVDYPDDTSRVYHYESANKYLLTGVSLVDAAGVVNRYSSFAYDGSGKAIRTEHAITTNGTAQEKFTLDYDSPTRTIVTDPVNAQEVMTFSTALGIKNLTLKENQSDGKTVAQTFDSNNNLTCRKDEESNITAYGYNATNQRISMTEGMTGTCENPLTVAGTTRTINYQYLSEEINLLTAVSAPSVATGQNRINAIQYTDSSHPYLPTIVTQTGYTPAGALVLPRTVMLGYNVTGQVTFIDGPRTDVSDITTLEYNECTAGAGCGQLLRVTNALGQVTTYDDYDIDGRLLQMTDPGGLVTTYSYDGRGRVKTATQARLTTAPAITRFSYSAWGDVKQIIDPSGVKIDFQYDAAHYLGDIRDANNNYIHYTYDLKGNRIGEDIYDSGGTIRHALTRTFDIYNHLDFIKTGFQSGDPLIPLETSSSLYGADGTLNQITDGEGIITGNRYDALKRLLGSTRDLDSLSALTQYSYDVSDRLTQVTDPNDGATSYAYDDLGNLLSISSPDTGITTYTYDAAGNTSTILNAKNQRYSYTYDALNRVTFFNAPRRISDITFEYDICEGGSGHLCSVSNRDSSVDYSYDGFGNIIAHQSVTYTYDEANRIRTMRYPSGAVISYSRDAAGQVTGIDLTRDDVTETILSDVTHVPFGPVESMAYGNGKQLEQFFDSAYRMTSQYITGVQDLAYAAYDGNGNIKMRANQLTAITDYFVYDALDRLVAANDAEYSYDRNGNRTQLIDDVMVLDYSYTTGSNRITRAGAENILVDKVGNIVQQGNRKYRYWPNNRVSRVFEDDILLATYTYNGLGQRQGKSLDKSFTGFIYGLGSELLVEQNVTNGTSKEYIYLDGQPIAVLEVPRSVSNSTRLTVTTTPALINAEITMDWAGIQFPTPTDWVGVYEVGAPKRSYLDWEYTDGSPSGTVGLILDHSSLVAGRMYEMRLYANDGYVLLATSAPFKLNPDTPTVILSSAPVVLNQDISVTWSGIVSTTPTDWAGVYEVGAPGRGYLDWVYTDGTSAGNATVLLTDQRMVVGKDYELRLYAADRIKALYAVSAPFTLEESVTDVSNSKLFYIHNDHLGTPQVMTDKEGSVVWQASYDPFGNVTVEPFSTVEMNIRFPGQYYDEESGLHYNYFRYYDPATGRYLSTDPIGLAGGINPHIYANANPLTFIDPDGLQPYLVSRSLAFTRLGAHNFVVSNANYVGDPNATIYSYGNNNFGNTGRVDQYTQGFSRTTSADDASFWKELSTTSCSVVDSSASPILAVDSIVDRYANLLIENTDYAAFGGIFGTNSNSAASAIANAAAGVPVPIPGPSYRLSPGAQNANQIQFRRP